MIQGDGSAQEWAERTFGTVRFADTRRTQRAVKIASALASDPMSSFPHQLGTWTDLKAAYRFFESAKTSYEQLISPHVEQTHTTMKQHARVLLVQDTSEVDYAHHPKTQGLGPVGNGRHHGYLLQSVLALDPHTGQVMGLAAQEPFLREPAPAGETRRACNERQKKESQVWLRQIRAIGPAPTGCEYVHVGDRGSDFFPFLRECQQHGCQFLIRQNHDRRVDLRVELADTPLPAGALRNGNGRSSKHEPIRHLEQEVRAWPAMGTDTLHLDSNHKRRERDAQLLISWGKLRLWPPEPEARAGAVPLVVTVIRTWEPDPPEGVEALEWLLLTSVEVSTEQEAWERVGWYRRRWTVEDYHQCLKTGCQIENRQVQSYEALRTVLGLLAPLAVRLLQLRDAARTEPERPAVEVLPADVVKVVAHLAKEPVERLSSRRCWHRIAQAGGFLGRKGDGEPGWKTLWKGWLHIQTVLEGIHLASQLSIE